MSKPLPLLDHFLWLCLSQQCDYEMWLFLNFLSPWAGSVSKPAWSPVNWGSSCNLSSLPVKASCFVIETDLSQWNCCNWMGWGRQPLGLLLFLRLLPGAISSPQSKPLSLYLHLWWESPTWSMWLAVPELPGLWFFKSLELLSLKAHLPAAGLHAASLSWALC
jgi:hypothetical protein